MIGTRFTVLALLCARLAGAALRRPRMIGKDKTRGERRDRTWRYAAWAQRTHFRVIHPDGVLDCACERSIWRFAKGKAVSCHSSKRRGTPKLPASLCHWQEGGYHDRVCQRIAGKRLAHGWLSVLRANNPLDVEW